jgi:hypothetical protein
VSYDGTELRGARNVILDGVDHRETAFHKLAFAAQYQFITGKPAGTLFITQEPKPTLNGRVTGVAENLYTNLPVADAEVEIYEVDPKSASAARPSRCIARRPVPTAMGAVHRQLRRSLRIRAAHGGPAGHPHLPLAVPALERRGASAARALCQGRRGRCRGGGDDPAAWLFRHRARQVLARRQAAVRHPEGVPSSAAGRQGFEAGPRTVIAVLNNETIATRTWPAKDNHIVVAEFLN